MGVVAIYHVGNSISIRHLKHTYRSVQSRSVMTTNEHLQQALHYYRQCCTIFVGGSLNMNWTQSLSEVTWKRTICEVVGSTSGLCCSPTKPENIYATSLNTHPYKQTMYLFLFLCCCFYINVTQTN